MVKPILGSGSPRLIKLLFAAVAVLVLLAVMVSVAAGDGVYHSDHIEFHPVGDQPLRSGFVENIHVNGPQVYAVERYVLNGASPNAEYYIKPNIYLVNAGCTAGLIDFPVTTAISTNGVGNGTALVTLPPEVAAGLAGVTANVRWELLAGASDGPVAYETDCAVIMLD